MCGRDLRCDSDQQWVQPRAFRRYSRIFLPGMDDLPDDSRASRLWSAVSPRALQDGAGRGSARLVLSKRSYPFHLPYVAYLLSLGGVHDYG